MVGVGDMSGDVFGNGMLRERTIKLVAAFDHRDIFIDPDPDPALSFKERERLFNLPRSSWQDYDRYLISPGGGVYSRAAKEIALSPQARAVLGLAAAKPTPQEVMKAILEAPVDLLWFGGIGTYVRASTESNEAVGDRANDAIRAVGAALRCKVIGEGANLGMTQRGRIEAALRGIRLNTDAIDNSAGVNTSDVEVNLKIALSLPLHDGRLTWPDRNALLASMTDEVAALVLRNNYQQNEGRDLVGHAGEQRIAVGQVRRPSCSGRLSAILRLTSTSGTVLAPAEIVDRIGVETGSRGAPPRSARRVVPRLAPSPITLQRSAAPTAPESRRWRGRPPPRCSRSTLRSIGADAAEPQEKRYLEDRLHDLLGRGMSLRRGRAGPARACRLRAISFARAQWTAARRAR